MSTVSNNRISAVMTDQMIGQVKTAFQDLNAAMPFLIGLNTDERVTLPKMSTINKGFVEDALNVIVNNQNLFPNYINIEELKKDLALYSQLDEILTIGMQFIEKVRDTQMLAGSEAYVAALSVYRMTEAASKAGIPGGDTIYNQLAERFAQSGPAPKPEDPETNQ